MNWLNTDAVMEHLTPQAVLLAAAALLGTVWLYRRHKYRGLPPGPTPLPLVGHLHHFIGNTKAHKTFYNWHKKYGNIYTLWMGKHPSVVICGQKLIREALVNNADYFSNRPTHMYTSELISNNEGLIWGKEWKNIRRFTLVALKDFGVGKNSLEERVQEEVALLCERLDGTEGQAVNVQRLLTLAFSNVICTVVFGKRFDFDDVKFKELMDIMFTIFHNGGIGSLVIDFMPWLGYLPGFNHIIKEIEHNRNTLENYVKSMIVEHKLTYDPDNIRDFIDLYIKTENEELHKDYLSLYTVQRVIIELFLAGTETSATTMTWALLLLVNHPHIQSKCREEIKNVIGTRIPQPTDRKNMPYVEATLMEIQRVANIAPFALPHAVSEDFELDGYKLRKGMFVQMFLYSSHHDETVWPDHDDFRPERWLDKDGQFNGKNPSFMPFSLGRRQCLGEQLARMELFVFFVTLIQRYEFMSPFPDRLPSLEGWLGLTLNPEVDSVKYNRL